MARSLWLEFAGAHNVTSRGDRREDIFEDDRGREMKVWSQILPFAF